jgi:hypothetical protein
MLTYATENWATDPSDNRKIESAEMKFLHPLAGYTVPDETKIQTWVQN